MRCDKCQFQRTEKCLSCKSKEVYSFPHNQYIFDGYDVPAQDTSGSEQVTPFDDKTEDLLRKLLFTIFDLSPSQLLVLKGIMNQRTIQEIARDLEDWTKRNQAFSRHKVFQLRKAILTKLPILKAALVTPGQRKELKASNKESTK